MRFEKRKRGKSVEENHFVSAESPSSYHCQSHSFSHFIFQISTFIWNRQNYDMIIMYARARTHSKWNYISDWKRNGFDSPKCDVVKKTCAFLYSVSICFFWFRRNRHYHSNVKSEPSHLALLHKSFGPYFSHHISCNYVTMCVCLGAATRIPKKRNNFGVS